MARVVTETSSKIDISTAGKVYIAERGEKKPNDFFETIEFLEERSEGVDLHVSTGGDEQCVELELSDYHVENPATGRAFHARLEVYLSWESAVHLRNYLDFALSLRNT